MLRRTRARGVGALARRAALLLVGLNSLLTAHFTWIAPPVALRLGHKNQILIAHGHQFPASEETINASQITAFAVAPDGNRTELKPVPGPEAVLLEYVPRQSGTHVAAFVQDRGVLSRTPGGLKPGGRDRHADAVESFRLLRTAVAYMPAERGALTAKPLGLELELCAQLSAGKVEVRLLRRGTPVAGQPVSLLTHGAEDAETLGKTDAQGRVTYRIEEGSKGPVLFLADVNEMGPQGAGVDRTSLSTSLYLNW